ncbi:hypothetical protein, conserved [Babesia bigemina]|uniref:C3H1-type domain-containing protein n=1 Tax=Babesia bigemina TaxID=5866 RepID=A0A061BQM6_BABBI|nr:hypothetical protein, conserved [Babesia bigemina]CDR71778.1 hypothetical protein, conserved [Babesia bigemina]|eukprot:XP_012770722.1 hypothetical protein, conserved [Babesia bigemina]
MQSVVTKMRNHVETELTKKLNAINENNLTHDPLLSKAVESAQALAKEYGQKGEDFNNGFNNITRDEFSRRSKVELKEQFKDLNSDLRSKINNARDNVSHEANRLTTLSATQKRNLEETIELIKQTCTSLKKCVNDKINKDVTELMNNVEKRVAEILKVLKEIESKIREYIDDLAKWINHADIDVGKAMKDMKGIIDKSIGWQNQDEISGKAKDLSKKATDLYWKFEGAKRSVEEGVDKAKTEKVNELTKWKAAGDAAVKQAKEKCDEIVGKLNGGDTEKDVGTKGGVKDAAEQLKSKAEELRGKALATKQKVAELVREALTAVKRMDDALKKNLLPAAIKKIENDLNKNADYLKNVDNDGNGDQNFHNTTFSTLRSTVDTSLTAFTDNVRNLVKKETAGDDTDSVHAYLLDLERMLNQNPVDLKTDIKSAHKSVQGLVTIKQEIDAALDGIDSKVKAEFGAANTATESATIFKKLSEEVTNNLKGLLKAFADRGQAVEKALQKIKDEKIGRKEHGDKSAATRGTLQKIHDDIVNVLRDQLEPVITSVTELQRFAQNEKYKCISSIHGFVDKEVQEATNKLITQANKNYVTSVKDMLQAFADKVQRELKLLPGEIDTDRKHGFKGFMRTLQGRINGNDTSNVNMQLLKEVADELSRPPLDNKATFQKLSKNFQKFFWPLKAYINGEIKRLHNEENKKNQKTPTEETLYTSMLGDINASFNDLLDHLKETNRYDSQVPEMLDKLSGAISKMKPEDFSKPNTPTMDSVTGGLSQFVDELRKVYISVYDHQTLKGELIKDYKQESSLRGVVEKYDLTAEGRDLSKVFLTMISIMSNDVSEMRSKCVYSWKTFKLNLHDKNNPLGLCFKGVGYAVSDSARMQNGELRNEMSCQSINEKLKAMVNGSEKLKQVKHWLSSNHNRDNGDEKTISAIDILDFLYDCLETYYRVCHVTSSSTGRHPSSVYDMLLWLTGLTHNRVYTELTLNGFEDLFEKPDEGAVEANTEDGIAVGVEKEVSLAAYPHDITAPRLSASLRDVCVYSETILVAVLGYGHAEGRYACDFNTNADKFAYPADMITLVCCLFDIVTRVHHQLYFLYRQCYSSDLSGWANCWYGRDIGGSNWKCNNIQCPEQRADQSHNQSCNQKCNQTVNCGLKSPLQSFLEDGLQGFLPHHLKFEKGKLQCSLKNHSGGPCNTPMGFGEISQMASHRYTGEHILNTLHEFCGSKMSPLTKLCSQLKCILPSAPKTLGDMFAFYCTLLNEWDKAAGTRQMHREDAFHKAVMDSNFENPQTELDITTIFKHRDHGTKPPSQKSSHITGDLYALVDCHTNSSSVSSHPCGPYLRPICQDMCATFTKENADKYLSWIVYCTESFLDLLKQLYKECATNCNSTGSRCRVSKCRNKCTATELPMSPGSAHDESCGSIVDCKFMRPTFYKYGFVLGDCNSLSAKTTKRTCKDLCMVLKSVTNEKEVDGHPLAKLVHVTIPQFIFQIRAPFIWLNVALWLLSVLYLIHIMVIRLDLLHIKSHLHSPSSHRIAAQSLLAAARVNKLNRVFYLQP